MPWKDSFEVVELGLWSILSIAAFVKTSPCILGGQTTCSLWNCRQFLLAGKTDEAHGPT